MKKKIIQVLFVIFNILSLTFVGCQSNHRTHTDIITNHPISQGISAPFAGFIGNELLVGGGCNFPDIPAAKGGKKVFYADFFTWNADSDTSQWEQITNLPLPIAYGASVEMGNSLILIGGMNEISSLKEVYSIEKSEKTNHFILRSLPSLPETIDNAAATRIGSSLYVTGGNQGNGGNSLYTLNLDTDSVWTRLADYPGTKRIQPVLLATDEDLYLFGGFDVVFPSEKDTKKRAIISSDFMIYNIKSNEWSEPQSIPTMKDGTERALVGCSGTYTDHFFIIAGGVNRSIFKDALEGNSPKDYMMRPSEWYQFCKELLIYDIQKHQWLVTPEADGFNKAGGILLNHNNSLYMICGEIKPGIRTNDVVKVDIRELLPTSSNF